MLGGGVVGVEMAQAWSSLGSHVTLVHRGDRLIEREEPFASEQVETALREGGVDVRLGTEVAAVSRNGVVRVELGGGEAVEADEILVSIGRTPRSADVGLDTIGLEPGKHVSVDESLRVPGHEAWLYAVGDVNGRALLTHMGKYQARLAADAILGKDVRLRSDGGASPRVIFTDPQVGAVGLTLAAAEEAGLDGARGRRRDERQRGRLLRRARRAGHGPARRRRGPRASSSARRSPAPRSPRRSTRRRSP